MTWNEFKGVQMTQNDLERLVMTWKDLASKMM